LWPGALVYVAPMALAATRSPVDHHFEFVAARGIVGLIGGFLSWWGGMLSQLLAPLACWVLAVTLIHEERLIGDEQYWLTRPYSWKDLVAAKALFLVVFVNVPLFVCQCAALAMVGLSPLEWLPALLWRQVFFSAFCILPAVAFGAITGNLGQVVLSGIVIYMLVDVGASLITGKHSPDWGGLDWIRNCGAAFVMAGGMAAAIVLQYTRRRTALARIIVAATLTLAFAAAIAPVWGGAFAIQKLFSREAAGPQVARVAFDESRAGAHPMQYGRSSNDPDGVRLEIPLRVENVPPGARMSANWTSVGVEGPNGVWRSGWLAFQALHKAHGEAWFTVYVDPEFYARNQDAPVRLWGVMDLTLYRRAGSVKTLEKGEVAVPGAGLCTFAPWLNDTGQGLVRQTRAACYAPVQKVAIALPDSDDDIWIGCPACAPIPTSTGFRPFESGSSWNLNLQVSSLEFYRPVAHMQRSFEARGLHMREYRFH